MRWRDKAMIQRALSRLPQPVAERFYFGVQRAVGVLRSVEPWDDLDAAREIASGAVRGGGSIAGARVVEVGTGHRLVIPIALWLLGASKVVTVDRHRYLKWRLVRRDLELMRSDPERVQELLSSPGGEVCPARLSALLRSTYGESGRLLRDLGIEYRSPADATRLADPEGCCDLHVSRSVLEHVPREGVERILSEATRVLREGGLLIHIVDFSDHFAHSDRSISSVNFLRFTPVEWERLAGNQFAYHNRLRSDDIEELFSRCGLTLKETKLNLDARALNAIENGFPLAAEFHGRDPVRLAHRCGLFVASMDGRSGDNTLE